MRKAVQECFKLKETPNRAPQMNPITIKHSKQSFQMFPEVGLFGRNIISWLVQIVNHVAFRQMSHICGMATCSRNTSTPADMSPMDLGSLKITLIGNDASWGEFMHWSTPMVHFSTIFSVPLGYLWSLSLKAVGLQRRNTGFHHVKNKNTATEQSNWSFCLSRKLITCVNCNIGPYKVNKDGTA